MEIRFMGAACLSIHVETKTTLESSCCPDLFESEVHARTMSQGGPDARTRTLAVTELEFSCAIIQLSLRKLLTHQSPVSRESKRGSGFLI